MKLCSKCKVNPASTSVHNGSYCKPCRSNYQAKYAKKTNYRQSKKRRKILRELIIELKSKPCIDCGIDYPWYVMDFDHVHDKKEFNLAIAAHKNISKQRILDEASKCEVVCSNCHRIRTFNRTNSGLA